MSVSKKILIIGGNGLIGQSLIQSMNGEQEWVATCHRRIESGFIPLDITHEQKVKTLIAKVQPDVIIQAANFAGGVMACEKHPDRARAFHYEATRYLGEGAKSCGAKLILISTECVFDGSNEVYSEEDAVSPLSVYGQCKADSEAWMQEHLDAYAVVRTMFVYGWQPDTITPNALMSTYFALQRGESPKIPTYRWGAPTLATHLAYAIKEIALSSTNGCFHVTGQTFCHRLEWMQQACRQLGWDHQKLLADDHPPEGPKLYPQRIRLDTSKFQSLFQTPLWNLERSLQEVKKQIEDQATSHKMH